jgi:hypothetical protein
MRGDVGTNDDSVPSPNEAGPSGLEAKVQGLAPVDDGGCAGTPARENTAAFNGIERK